MNRSHVAMAFASGCAAAALTGWLAVELRAQAPPDTTGNVIHVCAVAGGTLHVAPLNGPCPAGQQSMYLKKAASAPATPAAAPAAPSAAATDARIRTLEQRVVTLEQQVLRAKLAQRVTAPFEVVDRNGRRVFYVGEDHTARLYSSAGKDVVRLEATDSGGFLLTTNAAGSLVTAIGAAASEANVQILESGDVRAELGSNKRAPGVYRVVFEKNGKGIARLGDLAQGEGSAWVADTNGLLRAEMGLDDGHIGLIGIVNTNNKVVARLSEGSTAGGLMLITSADGTRMVDAGTADGIGLVRTGPGSFMMAAGIGLPGSFIMGKK